jgi:hypothetical protein
MPLYPCERISAVDYMVVFLFVGKILASIRERGIIIDYSWAGGERL